MKKQKTNEKEKKKKRWWQLSLIHSLSSFQVSSFSFYF